MKYVCYTARKADSALHTSMENLVSFWGYKLILDCKWKNFLSLPAVDKSVLCTEILVWLDDLAYC